MWDYFYLSKGLEISIKTCWNLYPQNREFLINLWPLQNKKHRAEMLICCQVYTVLKAVTRPSAVSSARAELQNISVVVARRR